MNRSFWKGRRVLVTGHTGFVGTYLTAILSYLHADITGFSLSEEKGSLFEKISSNLKIRNIYGDLRSGEDISECVSGIRPEIVIHLGAYGFVRECYDDPVAAYETNVMGTLNLLQALKQTGSAKCIVAASSDKVYQNDDCIGVLFSESDPLGGNDPYSSSKACQDILMQSYFDTYFTGKDVSLCILRPSNILGGGDHHINRLIPSIFDALSNGKKPQLKNPDSIRPWQNIWDAADAYLRLAEIAEGKKGGILIYNVGPETDRLHTTAEIVTFAESLFRQKDDITEETGEVLDRPKESELKEHAFLGLSIEKIKRETEWRPRRTLWDTIREVYQFTNSDLLGRPYEAVKEQMRDYFGLE